MVIIAAVDKSSGAKDVVMVAEELGKAFDVDVNVVHVMTTSEFTNLGVSGAKDNKPVDMEEIKKKATSISEDLASGLSIQSKAVGLMGNPSDKIVEYAKKNQTKYIVVGGRKRSPTGKAIFGSVSQSIILNSPCPTVVATTTN